jgi:NAD(P)-dependent dehydrogenase (short-subunit alcohol dehydrogenase family)
VAISIVQMAVAVLLLADPVAAQTAQSCAEPAAVATCNMSDNACKLKTRIGFASLHAPVKLDVTDRNSIIAAAVSSADTTVLINNAGIGGIVPVGREGGRHSMEQMTEVKWVTVQMGQRQFPF